jgi:short-subunit dehydrogenase
VVVIAGASNPTGFAFAERFATRFKLILIAEKEDAQTAKLKELYPDS